VNLFNEGVDIPSVDTLLFVRPTESLTVFTQQIGRGLRLNPGKEHCVIIDLIGNYRNADIKLSLFDTEPNHSKSKKIVPKVPDFCEIDLDLKVINLLEEKARKRQPRREKLYAVHNEKVDKFISNEVLTQISALSPEDKFAIDKIYLNTC
jgi:superfamily II DNA or RNA helicase